MNKNYQCSGILWEGRHKGNVIDSDTYFLTCMQYIELNPVRAGMVKHPEDYPWSSYSANGQGQPNAILIPHNEYRSLSKIKSERLIIYRRLLESRMNDQLVTDFTNSIQSGTHLGSQVFLDEIKETLNCKIGYAKRGRPLNIFTCKNKELVFQNRKVGTTDFLFCL